MKYPYIGKSPQGHYYLAVKEELIYSFLSKSWLFELDGFADLKRVSHEYLEDTKVKIKSKEHRGFIQKIIDYTGLYTTRDGDILYIMSQSNNKSACKEIHIPLPPKEPEPKDWPQVGDEVLTASGQAASIVAIDCGEAWVKYEKSSIGSGYGSVAIAALIEPPTQEEKLREKLKDELSSYISRHDPYDTLIDLTDGILNGEIDGLSYKPE